MEKMSSTGGYQKFVSSLKHDGHHIFIVQDSGNALGRGLSLGTAICRELQANSIVLCCERANGICRSPDPVLIRTVDEVSGFLDKDEEVIFLHSLTPLLIHASAHQILRMFQHVKEKNRKLVATIHGDCHDRQTTDILKQHSDIWLSITNPTFLQTQVIKFHSKGKVEKSLYDFTIEDAKVKSIVEANNSKIICSDTTTVVGDDNASMPISSFNLSLSDKEKEDRQQVEMPFWKKSSKIEYIPDENDDWDEEDPDDDLDF